MEAAVAPVSLKGTRDGLELIVAAGFLACVHNPVFGMIASASLAFGLRDLRKVQAAPFLGRWPLYGEISAWCTCALSAATFLMPGAAIPMDVADWIAWFSAASALRLLARAPESASLVRYFSIMRWVLVAPLLVVPLLLVLFSESMKQRAAPAGLVILVGPPLLLAILALRLRKAGRPYGKRVQEQSA